ncbi:hypothetical protein O6H91_13G061400 [Diphasiastrum complanatum]|uniref:Uncharacterized protein n=1 Tax=Diphasiastrum complanatum TaxID=34168 RepID=A0ACC2BVE9_DIPCM|nr:hypothetical protein O6H91_13G061400 [Diphasiastrum complanatum]
MAMEIRCWIPDAHALPILSLAFNSDRNEIFSGSQDCLIKVGALAFSQLDLFNRNPLQLRSQQGHQAWVTDLLYSSLVKILFSCSLDGNILAWSDKGKLLQVIEFGGPVTALSWDSKRRHLVAGGRGIVRLFHIIHSSANVFVNRNKFMTCYLNSHRVKFMQPSSYVSVHEDVVQAICCSESGDIFTTGFDRNICMFNSSNPGATMRKISKCHEGAICAAAYNIDGKVLLTGSYDGTVKMWSHAGHCLDTFKGVNDRVTSIAYVPSTKTIWVTGKDRYPIVIDAISLADVTEWVADTSNIRKLHLRKVHHASNQNLVIGSSKKHEIIIWRFNRFGPHRILQGHTDSVGCVVLAHRGQPNDNMQKSSAVDIDFRKEKPFSSSSRNVMCVSSKKNQKYLREQSAAGEKGLLDDSSIMEGNRTAQTEQKETSILLETLERDPQAIEIYSGAADGAILKWQRSLHKDANIWTLSEFGVASRHSILCMVHHPTLDVLVAGSDDCKIRVWKLNGHPSVFKWRKVSGLDSAPDLLRGHGDKVVGLCACNDEVLVSASNDRSLRWWNLRLRLSIHFIESAHDLPIEHLEYSSKRDELATCGREAIVKVWDANRRQLSYVLSSGSGNIVVVKWCNGDKDSWVTASDEGEISIWDPITKTQVKSVCYIKQVVTTLLVDELNGILLVTMQHDYAIRAYRLSLDKKEICIYVGHSDQVHSLVHLAHLDQYLSSSCDSTLRLWCVPDLNTYDNNTQGSSEVIEAPRNNVSEKELSTIDDIKYISTYEKEHPLVLPKSLIYDSPSTISNIACSTINFEQKAEDLENDSNLSKKLIDLELNLNPEP